MRRLVANRIITPDGTLLQSYHRHDYKSHDDVVSGETYMVDGGISYQRRSTNNIAATDVSVYSDDEHQLIRTAFHWNSMRGAIPLHGIGTDHLYAIIDTQVQLDEDIKNIFADEVIWRIEHENTR